MRLVVYGVNALFVPQNKVMADDSTDQLDIPADITVAEASTAPGPRRLPKKRTKTGCLSMLQNAGYLYGSLVDLTS